MRSRLIALFLALLAVMAIPTLTSCERIPEKYTTYSFDYFDTVTTVVGYARSQAEFDRIAGEALALLGEYHKLYTIYHRYEGMENLCTVNELVSGVHRTVRVDRRIIDLLTYAKDMYERTDGRVNVAMGSVLSLWHDCRQIGTADPSAAQIPSMEDLREAAEHTNIDDVLIDENASTVTLLDPKMKLDVGAVAKGYAVEMVARSLEEKGITGYVLNVGGNVRTVGYKGDGQPWTVGIDNPDGEGENAYFAYLSLAGQSLVTSGSYQRYYVVDGKRYHHIIDPDTLMPSEGYLSVSVVCPSSADGDALSTALFCMTPEAGLALIESLPDAEALWVMSDGSRQQSSGFAGYETE